MRAPEFAAFVGPARLYPQIWRILLGILLILFCYFGWVALTLVVGFAAVGQENYFGWLAQLTTPTDPVLTLVLLLTFGGLLLGTIIAAAACHFRGPGTLFGPWDETWRGFVTVLVVLMPLYGLVLGIGALFDPPLANMELVAWVRLLPLALPLLLIQTTAEEVLFRGYLQQQLAARFAARWIWMGLPALAFTSLHWSPEAGTNIWFILAATLGFALIAADLTERTGSLGAAMGLHFVNNIFALLVLGTKGTITGLALYITKYDIADSSTLPLSAGLDLILLLGVWRLLRFILDR